MNRRVTRGDGVVLTRYVKHSKGPVPCCPALRCKGNAWLSIESNGTAKATCGRAEFGEGKAE